MKTPDFNNDENYIISFTKSPAASASNPQIWGCIIGGAALAAIACAQGNMILLLVVFLLFAAFRLYEEKAQTHWILVWRSVIMKYEGVIKELNDDCDDSAV